MAKKTRKKAELGKGLGALLSGIKTEISTSENEVQVEDTIIAGESTAATVAMIAIDSVEVNPWQPRTEFEKETLDQLTESIKIHGLIQPITVRRLEKAAVPFQLISGERRLRASKLAGLTEVPAYVRTANDQEMLEMALVENIQRADLNPLEVAFTYRRLKDECSLDDSELADRVAKKRSTITNYLRLLKLPPNIQDALRAKDITMGHAKALAGVSDLLVQTDMFKKVMEHNLSVRATEALVAAYENPKKKTGGAQQSVPATVTAAYRDIEDGLRNLLETKVLLKRKSNGKGQIVIPFGSDSDLNRILEFLEKDGF
jgi:ParB family chromosome partitioning protein